MREGQATSCYGVEGTPLCVRSIRSKEANVPTDTIQTQGGSPDDYPTLPIDLCAFIGVRLIASERGIGSAKRTSTPAIRLSGLAWSIAALILYSPVHVATSPYLSVARLNADAIHETRLSDIKLACEELGEALSRVTRTRFQLELFNDLLLVSRTNPPAPKDCG